MEPRDFTQEELREALLKVSPIVFRYTVARLKKVILDDEKYRDISLNSFLSLVCAIMASCDANMFRWMETFYKMQTGDTLESEKLRAVFTKNLYEQLDIRLQ